MSDRTFVGTNIFVYAHDLDAGNKHDIAAAIVAELWESQCGVISTQVLEELYVTLRHKIPSPLKRAQVRRILDNYVAWDVAINDGPTILRATEIEEA